MIALKRTYTAVYGCYRCHEELGCRPFAWVRETGNYHLSGACKSCALQAAFEGKDVDRDTAA